MKLLFTHETKVKEDISGNYYTTGSYNERVWERYLGISTELSVLARLEHNKYQISEATKKFNPLNKKKINFIQVPNMGFSINLNSIQKTKLIRNSIIEKEIIKSDLVISRVPSFISNSAIYYARKYNKPYIIEVVGCAWDSLRTHSLKGKIVAPYIFYTTQDLIKKAPYVIYVTKNFLQNRYPTNGKHINCSDVDLPESDDSILHKRLKKISSMQNDKKIIIGTIGPLNIRYKGQQHVIKALRILKKNGVIFEYHLVGSGSNEFLRNLAMNEGILDNIKFIGTMPHNEIFSWLDIIDLYIQPSETEGLSRSLLEAMSRACPAIASSVGGNTELIGHDFSFKNKSVKNLTNIFNSINQETLAEQAKLNFNKSKLYKSDIIDKRRNEFFDMVKNNL